MSYQNKRKIKPIRREVRAEHKANTFYTAMPQIRVLDRRGMLNRQYLATVK